MLNNILKKYNLTYYHIIDKYQGLNDLTLINCNENKYILRKSHSKRSLNSLKLELQFIERCINLNLNVPKIVINNEGNPVTQLNKNKYTLFEYIKGDYLHTLLKNDYDYIVNFFKTTYENSSPNNHFRRPQIWIERCYIEQWDQIRSSLPIYIKREGDLIKKTSKNLFKEHIYCSKEVVSHNDIQPRNILKSNNKLYIIDFDDCVTSSTEWDITTNLSSFFLLFDTKLDYNYLINPWKGMLKDYSSFKDLILLNLFIRFTFFYNGIYEEHHTKIKTKLEKSLNFINKY